MSTLTNQFVSRLSKAFFVGTCSFGMAISANAAVECMAAK